MQPLTGDRFLTPGTKVRLDSLVNDNDEVVSEFGIVVACWDEKKICGYDCYVAFFGAGLPDGKPAEKPYVLRFAATSLKTVTA
jgi:hypothetical protein